MMANTGTYSTRWTPHTGDYLLMAPTDDGAVRLLRRTPNDREVQALVNELHLEGHPVVWVTRMAGVIAG